MQNCLAKGHRLESCRSSLACGGSHHTSLHDAASRPVAYAVTDVISDSEKDEISHYAPATNAEAPKSEIDQQT